MRTLDALDRCRRIHGQPRQCAFGQVFALHQKRRIAVIRRAAIKIIRSETEVINDAGFEIDKGADLGIVRRRFPLQ